MARSIGLLLGRWSAMLWLAVTTAYVLAISVLIVRDARFPLVLGAIRTTGRPGLWITLGLAIPGLIAFILIMRRLRAGSILLGIYCGLWTALLTSVLPFIWNARQSFCTRTMCIRTPWLGRLLVFGLMTLFAAAALWARQEFARTRHRTLPG